MGGTYMIQVYDVLHSSWVNVMPGNYIIRGIRGEYYPCNEEVFGETYEEETSDV